MTILKQVYQNQLQKEVTINYNFKAVAPTGIFADKGGQVGLTFNYYGGKFQKSDGTVADVADGSINLTDNTTTYIFFNASTNAVEANTTGVAVGNFPIAEIVTASGAITSITDTRVFALYAKGTRSDLAYNLPKASASVLGGIKIGTGLSIDVDGVVTASGGGSSVPVSDEGTQITSAVTSLNFVGAGVTATGSGAVTVTIPGGGSSLAWYNDTTKLKAFYKPAFESATAQIKLGSWTGTLTSVSSADYSSMGKWGSYQRAAMVTSTTAGNIKPFYLAAATGNHPFRRDPNAVSVVSVKIGASSSGSFTNASLAVALSTSSFLADPFGGTADFSGVATSTNFVCIGLRASDTNLQLITRASSGAALTFTDLGLARPVSGGNIAYNIVLESLNSSTDITYTITTIETGAVTTGTVTCFTTNGLILYPTIAIRTNEAAAKQLDISDIDFGYYPN